MIERERVDIKLTRAIGSSDDILLGRLLVEHISVSVCCASSGGVTGGEEVEPVLLECGYQQGRVWQVSLQVRILRSLLLDG